MWDFHFEAADRILGKECSSEPILPQLGNKSPSAPLGDAPEWREQGISF